MANRVILRTVLSTAIERRAARWISVFFRGIVSLTAILFLNGVLLQGTSRAALSAPTWMPSFPLVAGPQVILMWTPVPAATKYKIFLGEKLVGESVGINFAIPTPQKSGEHQLFIVAVDASGGESPRSAPGSIRIISLEPPKEVMGRLSDDFKNVGLRWESSGGAILYNIYRSEKSGQDFKLLASIQDMSYRDTSIGRGRTYFYTIKAKDASGKESDATPEFVVKVPKEGGEAGDGAEKKVVMIRVVEPLFEITGGLFGRLAGPKDLALDTKAGLIFVSAFADKALYVFSDKGEHVRTLEWKKGDPAAFVDPAGLDVDPGRKRIFVADSREQKIKVYSYEGEYLPGESFGVLPEHRKKYDDPEQEKMSLREQPGPFDVILSPDYDFLYVVDNARSKILKYSLKGKFLEEVSNGVGNAEPGMFSFPRHGKVNRSPGRRGDLIVMDGFATRVQIRDAKTGKWRAFGSYGLTAGDFKNPVDVETGKDGDLFTADKDLATVTQFDYEGNYKANLGTADGALMSFGAMIALSIDQEKGIVYTTDYANSRVIAVQLTDKIMARSKN